MAKEKIRGIESIPQNEENVKSFFEEIFGSTEAQPKSFVNPQSKKTFQPSNAQNEEDVKYFFEFISELNEINDEFGEIFDKACEAYFNDLVKPAINKSMSLTKRQTDVLIKQYSELFDMLLEMDEFLTELNDFVAYEFEQRFVGKPDCRLFSVTSDDDGNIVVTIENQR